MIARENLNLAWKKVRANKGAPGVDGLDIEATEARMREDWPRIEAQLLAGTYRPAPVRRVEIPKASGGNPLLRGWMNYFRLSETKGFAEELDGWVRRHLRAILWRQWKKPGTRYRRLRALGLEEDRARASAGNGRGAWFNSGASHLHAALPAKAFATMGLISLLELLQAAQARRSV